ncbi:MAG: ABC transporter permease, partial [Bifidobacteriaceae bacterium]|nr:ABC transporter permease [Bifidobacteriaceae bacterium]
KQTRVIEIILATVSAKVLLAGKILANSVLALGTVLLIATALILGLVAGGTGSMLTEQASALVAAGAPGAGVWEVVGPPLACFVVFFAAAFVLFCALMVGPAAMVSRLEDVGTVLMPSMLLCMGPYILVISFPENQTLINWLSFIPFSSGIAMPIRLIGGEVPWWQLATSFGILLVSTYLTILLAGRLYSGSILRTGARVKFMDAFKTQG